MTDSPSSVTKTASKRQTSPRRTAMNKTLSEGDLPRAVYAAAGDLSVPESATRRTRRDAQAILAKWNRPRAQQPRPESTISRAASVGDLSSEVFKKKVSGDGVCPQPLPRSDGFGIPENHHQVEGGRLAAAGARNFSPREHNTSTCRITTYNKRKEMCE